MGLDVLDASDGLRRTPSSSTLTSTFRRVLHRHVEFNRWPMPMKCPWGTALRCYRFPPDSPSR
jgi:hypothetical protein